MIETYSIMPTLTTNETQAQIVRVGEMYREALFQTYPEAAQHKNKLPTRVHFGTHWELTKVETQDYPKGNLPVYRKLVAIGCARN